jgi:hypothetical protein
MRGLKTKVLHASLCFLWNRLQVWSYPFSSPMCSELFSSCQIIITFLSRIKLYPFSSSSLSYSCMCVRVCPCVCVSIYPSVQSVTVTLSQSLSDCQSLTNRQTNTDRQTNKETLKGSPVKPSRFGANQQWTRTIEILTFRKSNP